MTIEIDRQTVTEENIEELREAIGALDQRAELQPGMTITYATFAYTGGQGGDILVVHNEGRAGIAFGGPSAWGDYDEDAQAVTLDEGYTDGSPEVRELSGHRVGCGCTVTEVTC